MSGLDKEMGVSHRERDSQGAEVLEVQNVALADATARAVVSPWTKRMFRVRTPEYCVFVMMTD